MKFALNRLGSFKTCTGKYHASSINWQQSGPANPGQEI